MRQIWGAILVVVLVLAATTVCAEEVADENKGNAALWLGSFLIAVGLIMSAKLDEPVFFAVFATQGMVLIINYLV